MIIAFRNHAGIDLYLAKFVEETSIRFTITTAPPKTKNRKEARLVIRLRKNDDYGISDLPDGFGIRIVPKGINLTIEHKGEIIPTFNEDGDAYGIQLSHEYIFRLTQ